MSEDERRDVLHWSVVMLITLAVVGAWALYLCVLQPACGAPGNTALGRSNRYVPWGLLLVDAVTVATVGRWRGYRGPMILAAAITSLVVAAVAGIVVFLFWFGAGDCGE
jgi:hypothetical protein